MGRPTGETFMKSFQLSVTFFTILNSKTLVANVQKPLITTSFGLRMCLLLKVNVFVFAICRVAILVNTADCYSRNTYRINGERALAVFALKKAGYIVVQVKCHFTGTGTYFETT